MIRGSGRRSTSASPSTSRNSSGSTVSPPGRCRSISITATARRCRALIDEYDIDPYDFLDFAHDIDHTDIELNAVPRPRHRTAAGPKAHPHQRLAQARGERGAQDRHPRPFRGRVRHRGLRLRAEARPARLRALPRKARGRAGRSAMFEDIAKNLVVPHDLGMTTTLIIPKTLDPFRRIVRAGGGRGAPHRPHHRRPREFPRLLRANRCEGMTLRRRLQRPVQACFSCRMMPYLSCRRMMPESVLS